MKKTLAVSTSMFLFMAAANGQTAADLAKKYQHHEVYEVKPGVQMTPKFDYWSGLRNASRAGTLRQ